MFSRRSPVSFIVFGVALALTACVFLPWVEAGVLDGSDFVNGIDIPVLGWSMLIVSLIVTGLVLIAALHGSPWLWLTSNFFVVLLATLLALSLGLLDVVDSAVVNWVVRTLPEEVQASTPKLAASFGLWMMFLASLVATGATAAAAIGASRHGHVEEEPEVPWTSQPSPFPQAQALSPTYTPPTGWWSNPN